MSRRFAASLPRLFAATMLAACASTDAVIAPSGDGADEARSATGVVAEDATYQICGVPMRVETYGKEKRIGLPSRGIIAFPSTTVRLTNLLTNTSVAVSSSGTLLFRVENGIVVVDLRGRNVLVNTTKGTATLFVGTFTERVNEQGDGVYTGTGQMTNLCTQLAG